MPTSQYLSGQAGVAHTRDGRALTYATAGGGALVVLEAGMGASSLSWRPTYEALAGCCRVLAYDRAGLGGSDRDPQPRRLDRLVDDLEDLLTGLNAEPAVLVGHSFGGLLVRRLAARRPDLVSAVVLLDPTDEAASFYRSGKIRVANTVAYKLMYLLASVGLLSRLQLRAGAGRLLDEACAGLDAGDREAFVRDFFSARTMGAANREMAQLGTVMNDLAASPRTLPMPVTLISAGRASSREANIRSEIQNVHASFIDGCPHGRHVLAADSGHALPLEAPQLVTDEIIKLLNAVSSGVPPKAEV